MLKLAKQKPSLNTKHLNCLFQRNSYIINNLRKNKVFLFCAKNKVYLLGAKTIAQSRRWEIGW